jgi:tetratricopeptide (TPR) repeat protein
MRAGGSRLTPEFADWAERIQAARADIMAALDWSLEHEPRADTLRAGAGLLEYWFRRGDPAPAYAYGIRMLDGAEAAPAGLRAAAQLCAGFGGIFAGDIPRATQGIDSAIVLLEQEDDWRSLCWALLGRGQNAIVLGDFATAGTMGRRILDLCSEHDAHLPRAYGLALLAENEFFSEGDLAVARSYVDEAIDGFRRLRDPASLNVFGLGIAASIAATQGDYAGAEQYAEEATTLPGPGWAATAYIILGGWVLHPRGDIDRAKRVLIRGVGMAHEMSMEPWVRNGLLFLAGVAADQHQWERAAHLFGACRPQPPWGLHPRWWTAEPIVRDAIGADRYARIIERAAHDPLDEVVTWVLES